MPPVTGLGEPVLRPPLVPPVTGLYQAAEVIEPADDRWHMGIRWSPGDGWVTLDAIGPEFCQATPTAFGTSNTRRSIVDVLPFSLTAHDKCSTWGLNEQERIDRAVETLDAREWGDVEAEFEAGTLVPTNPHLASVISGVTTFPASTTALSAKDAIAALDEAIAAARIGQGMLHLPPYVFAQATGSRSVGINPATPEVDLPAIPIRQRHYFSPKGNIVVAGNGYAGLDTTGALAASHASQYAYATDLVQLYRDREPEVRIDRPFDTATNTITARATRFYAVAWSQLLHAAVKVATPWVAGP